MIKSLFLNIFLPEIIIFNKLFLLKFVILNNYYNKLSNLFLYYLYNNINSLSLFINDAIFASANPV